MRTGFSAACTTGAPNPAPGVNPNRSIAGWACAFQRSRITLASNGRGATALSSMI